MPQDTCRSQRTTWQSVLSFRCVGLKDHQACQQVLLPTEPSHWPTQNIVKSLVLGRLLMLTLGFHTHANLHTHTPKQSKTE